jgi:2-polyprenyl-6-methoxyphenol hydroxylase-like FAD-dependent oxidoreductase
MAIIGAGIAGLSAAIALRRSNHKVIVYERSSFKQEIGAAISIPPNATRVLDRLSFSFPAAKASELLQIRRVDSKSLDVKHQDSFEKMEERYGCKWWSVHRVDLHSELKKLATCTEGVGRPVEIRLGVRVVGLDVETGVVRLEDGMSVTADLVVVADGTHSHFLQEVVGREVPMLKTGVSTYRGLVRFEEAMRTPGLREVFEGELPGFYIPTNFEKGIRIVTYPCRDETLLNWAIVHPTREMDQEKDSEKWNHPVEIEDVLERLEGFHPAWRELCTGMEEVRYFTIMSHEPLERICRGKAVLIGDAGHPMLPTHGQGAAMAIEDAAALEAIFSPNARKDEVQKRLEVYQKARLLRSMITQVLSNKGLGSRKSLEEAILKVDPCAVIPADGVPHLSEQYRDYFFSYDAHTEARKALAEANLE